MRSNGDGTFGGSSSGEDYFGKDGSGPCRLEKNRQEQRGDKRDDDISYSQNSIHWADVNGDGKADMIC